MSTYETIQPTAAVAYSRPTVTKLPDGSERTGTPTMLFTSNPAVEELATGVQILGLGKNVHFAARLIEPDTTSDLREGDQASFTWRGVLRVLRVEKIEGPFHEANDPDPDHREILVVKSIKKAA